MNKEYSESLVNLLADMPDVSKGKEGYGYKYVDFNEVVQKTRPVLQKHGFAIVQTVGGTGENIHITTRLIHKSGEEISDTFAVPPVVLKGTNSAQQLGAAVTYGRRYGWVTILGLAVDEDTDGVPKKQETYSRPVKEEATGKVSIAPDKLAILKDMHSFVESQGWDKGLVTGKVIMRWPDIPMKEGGVDWSQITNEMCKKIFQHLKDEAKMEAM